MPQHIYTMLEESARADARQMVSAAERSLLCSKHLVLAGNKTEAFWEYWKDRGVLVSTYTRQALDAVWKSASDVAASALVSTLAKQGEGVCVDAASLESVLEALYVGDVAVAPGPVDIDIDTVPAKDAQTYNLQQDNFVYSHSSLAFSFGAIANRVTVRRRRRT
jgi:hypothetical protein